MPESTKNLPHFEHVVIVGVGLLGASLGLAMCEKNLAGQITGVGRKGSASLDVALGRGAIQAAEFDLETAASKADLVLLCAPVRQFPQALEALGKAMKPGSLLTDVGSTKEQVMTWSQEFLPEGGEGGPVFVGSHPMAGSEKRGPEHARADLFQNALCLLCQSPRDHEARALAKVERFWQAVGMRTLRLAPQEHDRWVANISHLPHAAAAALVEAVAHHPESIQAAAGGLFDTTRIASSDVEMWTDIFLTNSKAVAAGVNVFIDRLQEFQKALEAGDEGAIRKHLMAAKTARDQWVAQRHGVAPKVDRRT